MIVKLFKLVASGVSLKVVRVTAMVFITSRLAKSLSPGDFGLYSYAISISSIATVAAMMGLPTLALREAAKLAVSSDLGKLKGLLCTSLTKSIILSSLAVVLFGAVAFALWSHDSRTLRLILPAIVFLPVIGSVAQTATGITKGCGRPIWGQFSESIVFPTAFFLLILIQSHAPQGQTTAQTALTLHIVSLFAAAAISVLIAAAVTLKAGRNRPIASRKFRFPNGSIAAMVYLGLYDATAILFQNVDIVMVGYFLKDSAVGLYRISTQYISLMILSVGVINSITMPMFAEHAKNDDRDKLNEIFQANRLIAFSAGGAVLFLFLMFSRPITIALFGEQYLAATGPMFALGIGQMVNIALGPVAAVLTMDGRERTVFKAMLAALLVNVALNILLIPQMGLMGAAIATAIAIVFSKLSMIFFTIQQRNLIPMVFSVGGIRL